MTFLWPTLLWSLCALPLLVLAYLLILRRRQRQALRYASLRTVNEALGRGIGLRRHIPAALLFLSMAALLFGIARPAATVDLPSLRGTVILAMDISGSMRARDILPSRLEAAQAAARDFVRAQPRDVRIGVVAFAATATLVQAPTEDRSQVLAAIDRFRPQYGTAVGNGILASLSAIFEGSHIDIGPVEGSTLGAGYPNGSPSAAPLGGAPAPSQGESPPPVAPGSFKSAAIILLSDGQTNTGPNPLEAARKSADLGVRIFTVGLGTTDGQVLRFGGWAMRAQLDEAALKSIADTTLGRYYRADSAESLRGIYQLLGSQFSVEKQKTEITALFGAAAALLLLAGAGFSLLWFGRLF
ncbi:MAG TPA: VWA domain-containing protein [Rectinemataceae bacterium]|nr:VWA domain-containing protein [Rectinemataceae bacterium]